MSLSDCCCRSPVLHNNNVAFTAEGDLWLHSLKCNLINKLTTHSAKRTQYSTSVYGNSIAFAANYEGDTEVYVIPVLAGVAKRVTFENSQVRLQG